ncbi:hypothetical protein FGG08_006747 [Glutinoglossum americanum]|uniref:DNA polymerase zeta catalytic subunit n=1 Tax=Glutinoglossum americanum TaxID=1670608 RepID=A0A9P8I084_9PEZI|nr:hypothetical protein FGG08_006747 [Glutinoglossum americanum]
MAQFRMRLNCIDHYQAVPSHFDPQIFRGDGISKDVVPEVPVIRVFGATETGQKVCAHIHGAFPYVFIQYHGKLDPEKVNPYIHRLHLSIDHALSVSFRRNKNDSKFVARITPVKGVPFYGYHVGHTYFLKIYIFNPRHMTRLVDLLQQGSIMKTVFQPYESHLQYLLQWMCDYNLYGCGYIDCGKVKFRNPVPDYEEINSPAHLWHSQSITPQMISDENSFQRQSHCSLEVDICAQDILNRRDVEPRPIHHDFTEMTNPLPPDVKLVPSMAGLWEDEARRRKAMNPAADPDSSPFPLDALVSMSAEPRSSQKSGWIHEDEYTGMIDALTTDERSKNGEQEVSFDTFVKADPAEAIVRSVYSSVEDFYPDELGEEQAKSCEWYQANLRATIDGETGDVEVNETRIYTMEEEDYPYDSDEGLAKELDLLSQRIHGGQQTKPEEEDIAIKGDHSYLSSRGEHRDGAQPAPNAVLNRTSPNELARLGIRDINDFNHISEDDFDVLPEFASDITSASKTALQSMREPLTLPPSKRRKVFHNTGSYRPRGEITTSTGAETVEDKLLPFAQHAKPTSGNNKGLQGGKPSANNVFTPDPFLSSQRSQRIGGASRANSASGNRALPYPVVKDPNDLGTIQRLSQHSDAAQEGLKSLISGEVSLESADSGAKARVSLDFSSNSVASSGRETGTSTEMFHVAKSIHLSFNIPTETQTLLFTLAPPDGASLLSTMGDFELPQVIYRDPYYSNEKDVPDRPREYAGREFKLESDTAPFLPEFNTGGPFDSTIERIGSRFDKTKEEKVLQYRRRACRLRSWEISEMPPSRGEVKEWLRRGNESPEIGTGEKNRSKGGELSQIDGPTQKNRHGFMYSQKQETTSVRHETQYMSIMSLEIHVNTRGNLAPDPEQDEVSCVFWCLQSDEEGLESNGINEGTHIGIIALSCEDGLAKKISKQVAVRVEEEPTELDLINRVVDVVRFYDPDILAGYEVYRGSWGYLMERAGHKYDYNLSDELSRTVSHLSGRSKPQMTSWEISHGQANVVTGRHLLNIWRMVQSELHLLQYTLENVVFHLLHRRIPHYPHGDLTAWYQNGKGQDLAKCIDYYVSRVRLNLEILDRNELIPRTSEQARILGVDFFSVISRGSQFKVESIMFRLAKPENFILPSPSRKQVGGQNALECLPLVMEPQSAFYTSPVLVLDFQSLYPSIMIAYNYCYSTFLGRVVSWKGQNKMGFTNYERKLGLLGLFRDQINVAPNGIMYVKQEIRKSLLAKMLGEILETRVMVKSGMKTDKDDRTLQRLLNNRQLALKLLANVTYGYTSASFSGRMPCSEIADSIVQSGRETLEKAIAFIHSVERWGAEVVYGDTDSIFIHLKGRTKDEAFDIGEEIANAVTNINPRPVKLKFEKVYFPCVLLAKKRYIGFKYEHKGQKEPEFEAKGTETVRRDGTPAEQKIEEKALRILFQTSDLSQVKEYFQRQCSKIMKGKVSVQDFCFAREVRLGTYSEKGPPPPGALISTRKMKEDPRAEPQYGERVPYVVVTGAPGARLIDRCVSPETLLKNKWAVLLIYELVSHIELDAEYYISKNLIPPLERIFNLVGANVRTWYDEMPKFQRIRRIESRSHGDGVQEAANSKKTIESYMKSSSCFVCGERQDSRVAICDGCVRSRETSMLTLRTRLTKREKKAVDLLNVCRSCAGLAFSEEVKCDSMDCPVFYSRTRQMAELRSIKASGRPVMKILEELRGDWSLRRVSTFFPSAGVMWTLTQFLVVYIFGGLTFIPLILCLVLFHAYFAFPTRTLADDEDAKISLQRPGDDESILKSGTEDFEKFARPRGHEPDVAAGYFAVCREYVPGGINGKPPERTTPVGTVVPESPSVYQSMYRSIFDRKQSPSLDPAKGAKRARNVFFVVLRHGHLMLYDDSEQLEVRHVISLTHHSVSITGGGDPIPDGELWIRRNAICLTRKGDVGELTADGLVSKPFYLFAENCSDKEDFYFALLQNQDHTHESKEETPKPLQFEVKDIIGLVQRLHSSEEHLQTRWINGLVGRLFLALYKTPEIENAVRMKIAKKISRVKKPNFLSDIVLQKIYMGEGAPYITNPRLRDLTVDGDSSAEMDLNYTGNFRIEVAATARIDLGSRFKAREVNLVLAVVVKKLEGHFIVRFKPPPSNRIWITFETMPKIELSIEPIVSSRQITYNIILRAIESRIREVIAETLVLPHWDDISFTDTMRQRFRGGIWANDKLRHSRDVATGDEEKNEIESSVGRPGISVLGSKEKSMSMPALPMSTSAHIASTHSLSQVKESGISSAIEARVRAGKPRHMRSGSFTSAASPVVSMDTTNVDAVRERKEGERQNAATVMMAISNRSQSPTPTDSPVGSPSRASTTISEGSSYSSASSKEDNPDTDLAAGLSMAPPHTPSNPSDLNLDAQKHPAALGNVPSRSGSTLSVAHSASPSEKRHSVASIGSAATAATAAAKKWGWGVLSRSNEPRTGTDGVANSAKEGSPTQPVGRGRPLPPPGVPLPPPERNRNKSTPVNVPKRKSLPPPLFSQRQHEGETERRPVPIPPLPPRQTGELHRADEGDDGLLVVAAPPDSEPTTPLEDSRNDFIHSLELDDDVDNGLESNKEPQEQHSSRPQLPPRSYPGQTDRGELEPSDDKATAMSNWQAAQEEEARSKSIWADTDNGHS